MTSRPTVAITPTISVAVSRVTSRRSRRRRGGSGKSSSAGVLSRMSEPSRQLRVTLAGAPGERLDKALAAVVPEALALSRSRLQALILDGAVATEQGMVLADPRARVAAGDRAGADACRRRSRSTPRPRRSRSSSCTRTTHLMVIDKPAGLVVHPAPGAPAGTLVNALLHHARRAAFGDRRADPARDRAPDRQGHLGAPGRRQDRRRAPGAAGAVQGARPRAALPRGGARRAGPGRGAAAASRRHRLGAGRRCCGSRARSGGTRATASGWRC